MSSSHGWVTVQIVPMDDSTYFYGFQEISKTSNNNSPFDFILQYDNPYIISINLATTTYRQSMIFSAIYLFSNFSCSSGTNWIKNLTKCEACSNSTYYDQST